MGLGFKKYQLGKNGILLVYFPSYTFGYYSGDIIYCIRTSKFKNNWFHGIVLKLLLHYIVYS